MLKLQIDQIAICPPNPEKAIELLTAMGAADWVKDTVVARGFVRGAGAENTAHLAFNYTALEKARELEVLSYRAGPNWMANVGHCVSHFGMHCTTEELQEWRKFFSARKIPVAQEVNTISHINPAIAGKRWYKYVIFHTRPILGVDIKFIVRKEAP